MQKHINTNTVIIRTDISIQTHISFRCSVRINPSQEMYITKNPRQGILGNVFSKISERIKHNIYIITFTNNPTSLVSVVNPSYYNWVFNEGNCIVSDVAEKSIVGRIDWFGVIINLLPQIELLMYDKPISLLVGVTDMCGIVFYQVYLLPCITVLPRFLFV